MKAVLLSLLFLAVAIISNAQNEVQEKKVVCYYTNWSPYRQNNKFTPSTIDPNLCTHLIYAFATFSSNLGIASSDEYQDITKNGYKDFNQLKEQNKNLKTLLSIGGWSEGSSRFSNLAAAEDRRNAFTQSAIEFLRKHNFDGINMDWQFPGLRAGSRKEDKGHYVKLVEALRVGFENEAKKSNKPALLLTMSIPSEIEYCEQGYDFLNLEKYTDFFNILAYDYHYSSERNASHHSPLYPLPNESAEKINIDLNADATVQYLLSKGMMKEKLNLGIPTYGRTFKLANKDNFNLGAPSKGSGIRDDNSSGLGFQTYYDICKKVKEENWTEVHVNKTALGPFAYKDEDWVGYDDADSVRMKGEYVKKLGLGGIMFWTIDDDDFGGNCGHGKFPLINAGRQGVLGKQ